MDLSERSTAEPLLSLCLYVLAHSQACFLKGLWDEEFQRPPVSRHSLTHSDPCTRWVFCLLFSGLRNSSKVSLWALESYCRWHRWQLNTSEVIVTSYGRPYGVHVYYLVSALKWRWTMGIVWEGGSCGVLCVCFVNVFLPEKHCGCCWYDNGTACLRLHGTRLLCLFQQLHLLFHLLWRCSLLFGYWEDMISCSLCHNTHYKQRQFPTNSMKWFC